MNYNKINNIAGWACGILATLVYVMTMERTTSFWDTGEFIASAYKMQIVHQPGAPLFLMLQNIFSNLAFGDEMRIAFWMNFGSAVSSGLTIVFLFWTITALARKTIAPRGAELTDWKLVQIIGAGAVGALAYTFSDTFWFSAVESEVYAMSSLCTAVVFWAILKWEHHADEPGADKWLVFIAYIMGLSIGVHLLNLLAIPAMALVVYFRRSAKVTAGGAVRALLIGCLVVAVVLWGIIQYLIKGAAYFDLFFVNTLGLGFGSGVWVFALLVIGGIVYGIWYSIQKVKPLLNIIFLSAAFIIFGYSSFAMILIRAHANPTLNNSDPDEVFAFLSYLNREQYGNEPKFKGPYFDSRPVDINFGGNQYRKGAERYEVAGQNFSYEYDRETIFPRIYSSDHERYYRDYLNLGEGERPTFGDNLRFFFSYQVGHMYGRYFLWNFAGRQNDEQGHGDLTSGNWISGIKFIDQMRLGGQDALPDALKTNPSNNKYYFLPLILGLLGAVWHFSRNQRDASVVGLLFFFTGLAIVLYLNQNPLQPRERDYAYAGSFYAFAIWIGLAVPWMAEKFAKKINAKTAGIAATALGLLAGPVIMASEGWDDHDRSEKFLARDIARNYLESCAPNAILFTYGDNDTYPLWYVQEVENFRTDVRVVNLSLLSADWYVRQVKEKVNDAEGLPIDIPDEKYVKGVRNVIYYQDAGLPGHIDLDRIVAVMLSDDPRDKRPMQVQSNELENFLPTKNLQLQVDREDVIKHAVVPEKWHDYIVDTMRWTYPQNHVTRSELSIMDVLSNNNWERPIYFATTVPSTHYMGLDNYLVSEGFALRVMPVALPDSLKVMQRDMVNGDNVYKQVLNKYQWGNIKNSRYVDPESYRMISLILNNIYASPAEQLIAEGKTEEARALLLDLFEHMPDRLFRALDSYGYAFVVDQLYKVGETEKANEVVEKNLDFLEQHLRYYAAIAETKPNLESENIQVAMVSLNRFALAADEHGQLDVHNRVMEVFNRYETRFFGGMN